MLSMRNRFVRKVRIYVTRKRILYHYFWKITAESIKKSLRVYKKKADRDVIKALDKLRYLKLSTWNQVDAYYQKCEEKYKVALDKWMKAEADHAITEDSAPSE